MQDNPYEIATLLQQGDFVIKGVAILLLVMSIASWTVIVVRGWYIMHLNKIAVTAERFWHARSFSAGLEVLGEGNPFRHVAERGNQALEHHVNHHGDLHDHLPIGEWLTGSLRSAIDECIENMQRGLSVLASVGSTAPFVGLFGTVWGIYHALVGISVSGQASIDKVAGPVGEALVMTAFGLAVAIPAVLAYNILLKGNKGLIGKLNRFSHQLHPYFLSQALVTDQQTNQSDSRV